MAKARGKRRSMKGYLKGNIDEQLVVSTLTAKSLVSAVFDESPEEQTLVSSIVCAYQMSGITPGEGPFLFGIAHSDYTDAEIEQVIEATTSWDAGDKIAQEIGRRLVRQLGQFEATTAQEDFNDGKPLKTKLNWKLNTSDTLRLWIYNLGANTLTDGSNLFANGHANLWQ